jgi:hypothetical protein
MLVTPPRTPSRATGEIEALLCELGHAPLAELDEERAALAENHDDLFEEIAAFARRGWAYWFDAETGYEFDEQTYQEMLSEILYPVHREVELADGARTVIAGGQRFSIRAPEQSDDWLDVRWLFEVAALILHESGWRLVTAGEDLHELVTGVVPDDVWRAIAARKLAGAWTPLTTAETDELGADDTELN